MHSLKLHTSRYPSSYNVSHRRSPGSLRTKIRPIATSEYVGVTTPCGGLASGIHVCFELQIGMFILAPSKLESTKLYMNVGSLFIIWSFACFALVLVVYLSLSAHSKRAESLHWLYIHVPGAKENVENWNRMLVCAFLRLGPFINPSTLHNKLLF